MLEIDVVKRLGGFSLEVRADIAEAGITALVGPSGAGKSTAAKLMAGLLAPDHGRIAFNGTVFFDSAAGVNIPAERRGIGFVFQEHRLFPHMSVMRNLAYGSFAGGRRTKADLADGGDFRHFGAARPPPRHALGRREPARFAGARDIGGGKFHYYGRAAFVARRGAQGRPYGLYREDTGTFRPPDNLYNAQQGGGNAAREKCDFDRRGPGEGARKPRGIDGERRQCLSRMSGIMKGWIYR